MIPCGVGGTCLKVKVSLEDEPTCVSLHALDMFCLPTRKKSGHVEHARNGSWEQVFVWSPGITLQVRVNARKG